MKAIRVTQHGGPEVLKLEEVQKPSAGPGQVLIEVCAAGVNPVDTYIRSGNYPNATLPYTPGFDCAGIVRELGEGVSKFKRGDLVYTSSTVTGAYAEFTVANVETVHDLPKGTAYNEGAALGIPYGTAYRALFQKAQAKAGELVLIHGASGGVGLAAVQLARAAGLVVIATASTEDGQELVRENGAHQVFNHKEEGYEEKIKALYNGRGVDLVLEMLANVNLARDLTLLAKFGRIVVIGNRGAIEINPRETMSRDATIIGMTLFNASPVEVQRIHAALYAGLEAAFLRPMVGKQFELKDAPKAHELILSPGAYGKIVLLPRDRDREKIA